MNPDLFEPIPASRLRRDLRTVLRRLEHGEGPFRITRRNGPDLVLLPTEPYAFAARHVAEVRAAVPGADVHILDGRDLFWWGTRTPTALTRLGVALR